MYKPLTEDYASINDSVLLGFEELFSKHHDRVKADEGLELIPLAAAEAAKGIAWIQPRIIAVGQKKAR